MTYQNPTPSDESKGCGQSRSCTHHLTSMQSPGKGLTLYSQSPYGMMRHCPPSVFCRHHRSRMHRNWPPSTPRDRYSLLPPVRTSTSRQAALPQDHQFPATRKWQAALWMAQMHFPLGSEPVVARHQPMEAERRQERQRTHRWAGRGSSLCHQGLSTQGLLTTRQQSAPTTSNTTLFLSMPSLLLTPLQ